MVSKVDVYICDEIIAASYGFACTIGTFKGNIL